MRVIRKKCGRDEVDILCEIWIVRKRRRRRERGRGRSQREGGGKGGGAKRGGKQD
jgi:hypothetical protein